MFSASPPVWVSSIRTVTAGWANSGRYRVAGASSPTSPRSTARSTATDVKSLVSEARSKMVSVRIATRCAAGRSVTVPATAAYRTASPTATCAATIPCRAASTTAPA